MDKQLGNAITIAGIGLSVLSILFPSLVEDLPMWLVIPGLLIGLGLVVFGLYLARQHIGILPATIARPLLRQPSVSTVRKYGVVLAVRLRWDDDTGKPLVAVDEGRVTHVWAALEVEVRNLDPVPKRLSEIYLEFKDARFPRRVIAIADPASIDTEEWHGRDFPRRVEWPLEPVSEAVSRHVRFDRGWKPGDPSAPRDPKRFSAAVVAELGGPHRRIRVELGEDILK